MNLLIAVIAIILISGVAYWAVIKLSSALGLPAPVVVVAQVIIVVAAVIALIGQLGWVHV